MPEDQIDAAGASRLERCTRTTSIDPAPCRMRAFTNLRMPLFYQPMKWIERASHAAIAHVSHTG
ncbi:hypothetical protein [Hydrogenophaga sp.]|uniref:hypothetical protein n=1 Tax=Hydrogenophaga sp. TaxID=1904254 RepID=UPI0025C1581A|nr:hypothetical protein [Hydrogenophaga sp.]